jgi:hypothetical protein
MKFIFGKERIINDEYSKLGYENVIRWDVIEIENDKEQELRFDFVSTNSKYRQGVRIASDYGDGYIEINGVISKEFQLWEDTCPHNISIKCRNNEGKISIYNIFDLGASRGGIKSQVDSSGMVIETNNKCRIYKCNDFGFQTDFNKLIFKIELV